MIWFYWIFTKIYVLRAFVKLRQFMLLALCLLVHLFFQLIVASGADLRTAQTLLRHANLQTTAIYVQVADEKRSEAIDRLDPFD
jgi:site-specific recombinase XerD